MTFLILLFLNTLFCVVLFLYFRERFQKMAQGEQLREELGGLISAFNQTADKHITQLDDLLERAGQAEERLRALLVSLPISTKLKPDLLKEDFSTKYLGSNSTSSESSKKKTLTKRSRDSFLGDEAPHAELTVNDQILRLDAESLSSEVTKSSFSTAKGKKSQQFHEKEFESQPKLERPYENLERAARLKKVLDQRQSEILNTLSLPEKIKFLSEQEESEKKIAERLGVSLSEIQLVLARSI